MSSNNERELNDTVIKLHDCARTVESVLGTCTLADEIRKCADNISQLIKPFSTSKVD